MKLSLDPANNVASLREQCLEFNVVIAVRGTTEPKSFHSRRVTMGLLDSLFVALRRFDFESS